MLKKCIVASFLLAVLSLLSGCAVNGATASVTPDADLKAMKTFYVVKSPKDDNNVDQLIKDYLIKKGYSVTSGPELAPPYQTDGVVTYIHHLALAHQSPPEYRRRRHEKHCNCGEIG